MARQTRLVMLDKLLGIGGIMLLLGLVVALTFRFVMQRLKTRELAEQRSREAAVARPVTGTPREILQSMAQNLTAVNRSDVSPGETCSICLGDLAHEVERREEEPRPTIPTREPAAVRVSIGAKEDEGHVVISLQLDSFTDPVSGGQGSCGSAGAVGADDASADDVVTTGPALQSLRCGHCFHGECIRGWIVHRGAGVGCPLCKHELAVQSRPAAPEDATEQV